MSSKKISPYIPYMILTLCTIVLLIRAPYSFCWSDETFYFSTTNRFFQGDGIFLHEWFPTQLVSLILLPLYSLYHILTGSTAGILLFFRICFVLFSFLVSLLVYRLIKKDYPHFIALMCALLVLFYAHLNIATLSYYTMSVDFYIISMLLLAGSLSGKASHPRLYLVFSGITFAACVVCLPTMAVAYFLCTVCLVLISLRKKELRPVFPFTLIGICILAVIILGFILSRVNIMDLINNLPYILSDEEHTTSLVYPLKKFFISINEVYGCAAYAGYLLFLFSMLLGHRLNKKQRLLTAAFDLLLFFIYFYYSIGHTGYIFTAIVLFAMPLYFMTENRNKRFFFLLFGSGMIFSLVFSYSSNGYLYIMTLGHSIAAVGSICFISDFMTEMSDFKPVFYLGTAIISIVILQTVTLRLVNVYRDAPLAELTSQIAEGPAKGLYTTPAHKERYEEVLTTIEQYDLHEGNVFFTKLLPWGYLACDMRCGAPTTWRTTFDSKRLDLYYEANPERIPDLIFVLDDDIGSYEACGDVEADPTPNENSLGGFLSTYADEHNYTITETKIGTIYQR